MASEDTTADALDRIATRAHEAIDTARDQAHGVVGGLRGMVHDAGERLCERLKETASTTGKRLESAGHSVRAQSPPEGVMGAAASNVADVLERTGGYLEKRDLDDIRRDLKALLRRRPIESLLVSVGVGYLLGRTFRR